MNKICQKFYAYLNSPVGKAPQNIKFKFVKYFFLNLFYISVLFHTFAIGIGVIFSLFNGHQEPLYRRQDVFKEYSQWLFETPVWILAPIVMITLSILAAKKKVRQLK